MDSVTYAAETLLMGTGNVTAASDDADETVYYNIGGARSIRRRTVRPYGESGIPTMSASCWKAWCSRRLW